MPTARKRSTRMATMKEACGYGRFCRSQAYNLIEDGQIAAFKMGRRTMIDLNSVDAYHAKLKKIRSHQGASR